MLAEAGEIRRPPDNYFMRLAHCWEDHPGKKIAHDRLLNNSSFVGVQALNLAAHDNSVWFGLSLLSHRAKESQRLTLINADSLASAVTEVMAQQATRRSGRQADRFSTKVREIKMNWG